MNKIGPVSQQRSGEDKEQKPDPWQEDALADEVVVPLTAAQAQAWRGRQVELSLWRVLAWQLAVSVLLVASVWLIVRRISVVQSVAWGALSVLLPSVLFAWAMWSRRWREKTQAGLAGFFLWEFVKVALTVAMLMAAPKWVANLSWPGMLLAFLVTLKVYWVVVLRSSMRRPAKQAT